MSIKLIVLNSGENLISDIKEAHFENKIVCYILKNPRQITLNGEYEENEDESKYGVSFNCWPILSKNSTIELNPNSIVTISDPIEQIKSMYENQILEKGNESN